MTFETLSPELVYAQKGNIAFPGGPGSGPDYAAGMDVAIAKADAEKRLQDANPAETVTIATSAIKKAT